MRTAWLAPRQRALVITLGLACGRATYAAPACAEGSSDRVAAAQALFDRARELMIAGHYGDACPKLEESQRLDPASGTLLNLADCYEHQGRLASAWLKFLEAAAASRAGANVDRETTARDRAAALAGKVPKFVIKVSGDPTPGLEVRRDGEVVERNQWGVPLAADPGEHTISASAPGRSPWRTTATLKAADTTAIAVVIPELARTATPPEATLEARAAQPLGTQRLFAIAATGAGVVGMALGTVFALQSKSKHDDADRFCNGPACFDQRGVDLGEEAKQAGNVATIAFTAGALAVAGGALLWFTAPARTPAAGIGLGAGTLQVSGTW
jgi:hypothetical protein